VPVGDPLVAIVADKAFIHVGLDLRTWTIPPLLRQGLFRFETTAKKRWNRDIASHVEH
jgi:hypothetical protein